ncbi:hypothetical protein B0T26DRAFT_321844 [Lasiosphaeria miniovina]|uniref:Uncharacterized protein n=1 Tax=Lasiosphaeria miniovina TaxID=1954250 RepID=A0AA40ALU9_9PEZI|nr:uncharacterized protein B0T26DRAFT_321844 [Lasiosphaeria miniovina]KAK0718241.1 hypothetical protein B0T26DRAFT_321844 [Lasiosphaeria miniovina]
MEIFSLMPVLACGCVLPFPRSVSCRKSYPLPTTSLYILPTYIYTDIICLCVLPQWCKIDAFSPFEKDFFFIFPLPEAWVVCVDFSFLSLSTLSHPPPHPRFLSRTPPHTHTHKYFIRMTSICIVFVYIEVSV